jgi:hypothetical protein
LTGTSNTYRDATVPLDDAEQRTKVEANEEDAVSVLNMELAK